jgi:penicillin-binding protein 1A
LKAGSVLRFGQSNDNNDRRLSLRRANQLVDSSQAARRTAMRALNVVFFLCGCTGLYILVSVGLELQRVPNLSFLEHYQPVGYIQIFDRNDKAICQIAGSEKRTIIPLDHVTSHLQRAVLAAEDHHFYEHHGVDPVGILRAVVVNLVARHAVQGGSTITQQLVKNLFFEDEKRGLMVKMAEVLVSWQIEQRFSKNKILELYLNEVYFGNGAYGIEQAANLYFDKNASELNIGESSYIAGLIRSPARGALKQYRKENIARQHDVLDTMQALGYITHEQWQEAREEPLDFKARPQKKIAAAPMKYPYYLSYVLELVRDMYSEGQMQRHGLKVYTNLDPPAQEAAARALNNGIRNAPAGCTQGALVSVNVRDGAVVALVGGVGDYMKNQWNCATNPHTAGSAFKPFVYLTAFNRGVLAPMSPIADGPIVIKLANEPDYKPKNFDGKYMGDITVTEALALSRNTCAIRVAQQVGIDSVIETAHDAGIRSPLDSQISLALGCSAVSPLDMAAAYSTLARGGVYIKPSCIRRIDDKNGNNLWTYYPDKNQVFRSQPVAQLVDVLQEVVAQGTGAQAKLADRPVAGKTGTSDQAKDLWFVGFTPDLVTAVWGGSADNRPIAGSHTTGGTVMARIWRDYNRSYYAQHDVPQSWFVACTHLAGGFKFPQREITSDKTGSNNSNPDKHVPPPVVRYEDIDPSAARDEEVVPVRRPAATVRSGNGVVDYRWSR